MKRAWIPLLLLSGVTCFAEDVVVVGGTLLDGTGSAPRPNPGILLRDGRIAALGDVAQASPGAERISAEGKWVLPGMFDLHAHITFHLAGARDLEDDVVNAIRSERFLERYQEIGVTTVRDVASRYHVGYSLKRAQRDGLMGGARFYTCGPLITTTGGHATEFQPLIPPIWAVEADGPWEFRARVREAAKLGADFIKLTPPYTLEELTAAVEEAHSWKLRVTAHVGGAQDLHQVSGRIAVKAGVDSVEHLYPFGGEDVVAEMARKGIYVVPTMGYHLRELDDQYTYKSDWLEANLGHTYEGMMKLLARMRSAGIKFGVGTDSNAKDLPTIDALYLQELEGLLTGGLSPMEVVQSATLHAAEAMGLGDEAGSLEVGKWADAIVVDADPLQDIGTLVRPEVVIQDGEVVVRRSGANDLTGTWILEGYRLEGERVPAEGVMLFADGRFAMVYTMGPRMRSARGHGGSYRTEGDRVTFSIPWWVEHVDGEPRVFPSDVEAGARFEQNGDRLVLRFDSGSEQHFRRAAEARRSDLSGAWLLTEYESRAKTGEATGLAIFQGDHFALLYTMGGVDGRAHAGRFDKDGDDVELDVSWSLHVVGGEGTVEERPATRSTTATLGGGTLELELGGGAVMRFRGER